MSKKKAAKAAQEEPRPAKECGRGAKRGPRKNYRTTTDEQDKARLAAAHAAQRAASERWWDTFLRLLRQEKSVTKACEAAGVSRTAAYERRKSVETFADAWDECLETVRDDLEAGAMKRAVEGWLEPIYYKGQVVGTCRRFSAALTIFMLKTHRPDRYNLFFGEDEGGEGTPEQRAKRARDALRGMRGSVPTRPPGARDDADGSGADTPDGDAR